MRFTVGVYRLALDELHREVGQAVGRGAAVEQAADEWMVEAGEDLALVAEAPDDRLGVHAALEDLQRHPLLEGVVAPDREIHRAHAAAAQLSDQAVRADAAALNRLLGQQCGRWFVVARSHVLSILAPMALLILLLLLMPLFAILASLWTGL